MKACVIPGAICEMVNMSSVIIECESGVERDLKRFKSDLRIAFADAVAVRPTLRWRGSVCCEVLRIPDLRKGTPG